jgi:hypothetical protein
MKAMSERLYRTSRIGHRVPAFIAVPIVVVAFGFLIVMTAVAFLVPRSSVAAPGHPTKGPIPQAAYVANGIDAALVPDFVPVWGRDGTTVAGYIPKAYILGPTLPTVTSSRPEGDIAPVYADDLATLVGHMYPGRGFVPVGVDPNSIPTIPAQQGPAVLASAGPPTSLTLYIRSAAPTTRWLGVVAGSDPMGVDTTVPISAACLAGPVGGQLVMFDRPPQDADAITLGVIYQRAEANGWPTLWVDIAADGTFGQGTDTPSWWVGPPPPC